MRTTLVKVVSAFLICAAFTACGKGGGGNNNSSEATLAVTTNPTNGSTQAAAPGPTFALSVTVTSTMPPKGVTIAVSAAVDGQSGSPFYTTSVNNSQATNNFTIANTPAQETCLVTVTVTSNDKSSNVWTGSYRYSMK
ncbi:MAG TPA: hypothetical protein VL547_12280 [Dinghuibacter sp.]|jgi:hypothetical protein|uniref:hypothetical protein n=1 Tax=Dinghuibacter sp. TaxID=2024697 RepID=UPI002C108878|nr:hypothetical protein [Dinghuibacter sp.]HTJ12802.1 hypothetical protein [Dinghuibacter sp.]